MAFLPNGSLYYNSDTKRLHEGVFNDDGALVSWGKELGDYTFNLVPKTYPFSWVIQWLPGGARFYPVQTFATKETVTRLLERLNKVFPEIAWGYSGNTMSPTEIKEQVNLIATVKDGRTEHFSPGNLAVTIMLHGEQYAFGQLGTEIINAFGSVN